MGGVSETNPQLSAALAYAAAGWPVFPLRPRAKSPDGRLAPHGLHDATCDPRRLRAWWSASPEANVGVRTGVSIDVVDVDGPLSLLDQIGPGRLRLGPAVRTGRGWHLYFTATGLPTKAAVVPGVDTRGVGGYVVAPPSRHPDGGRYRFADPTTGAVVTAGVPAGLPRVPRCLLRLASPPQREASAERPPIRLDASAYARAALAGECAAVAGTAEGSRNHRLNRAAFAAGTLVGAGALDSAAATEALVNAALRSGLPESEARRTIASGLAAGVERPRQLSRDGRAPPQADRSGSAALVTARLDRLGARSADRPLPRKGPSR